MPRFEHTDDVALGAWIAPRLAQSWSTIAAFVPSGYETYVRILHPMEGDEPWLGGLPASEWALLAGAIGGDEPITIALWTGNGWISPEAGVRYVSIGFEGEPDGLPIDLSGYESHFDVDVRSAPQLELPGREYALFRGSLATVRSPTWQKDSGWAWAWKETFDLAWPDDHSWFAFSDTDLDSTVVGCTAALAERILRSDLDAAIVPHNASPNR